MTISDPNTAIGAAARLMMVHPAFARRGFGEWMQVLDGQARRGHQVFALDDTNRLVGFFGYAVCTEAVAVGWVEGRHAPTDAECRAGDCLIFNSWISEDMKVLRFMWNAFRRLARHKKAAYYKRFYADGTVRPVRLVINAAVEGHVRRAEAASNGHAAIAADLVA